MRVPRMTSRVAPVLLLAALGVLAFGERLEAQQSETDTSDTLKTSLTLESRTVTVSITNEPDATHRDLLASATAASVRIGTLDASRLLRVGTLDGHEAGGGPVLHYGLWLAHVDDVWQLEARHVALDTEENDDNDNEDDEDNEDNHDNHDTDTDDNDTHDDDTDDANDNEDEDGSPPRDTLDTIPLAHTETAAATNSLTAALIPSGDRAGQLVLAWGRDRWSADFTMAAPPAPNPAQRDPNAKRARRSGVPTSDLPFDLDNQAGYRAVALGERHETAVTLLGSGDISLMFWHGIGSDGPDFDSLSTIRDGDVVKVTMGGVTRLLTDVPLRFGGTTLATDNYSPDTPGQYGLWLKRVGSGWQLVFNHESDSWGTQYDPNFDVAAVDLAYSNDGPSSRSLGAALTPTSATSGRLAIHWGPHEWTVAFQTVP